MGICQDVPAGGRRCRSEGADHDDHATVLDITQNDNTAARTGDKLKRRVAFVTGGTVDRGRHLPQPGQQGATLAAGYAGNDDAAKKFRDGFASTYARGELHKGTWARPADLPAHHRRGDRGPTAASTCSSQRGITIDKTVLQALRRGLVRC